LVVAPAGYNLTAKTTPLFPTNQHSEHGMQHKDYDPALHNSRLKEDDGIYKMTQNR
jgi:hypothetical protein